MNSEEAVDALAKAFEEDPSYAYSWHCNIAMSCYDSLNGTTKWRHKVSNAAASRFMKLAFGVDTQHPDYKP